MKPIIERAKDAFAKELEKDNTDISFISAYSNGVKDTVEATVKWLSEYITKYGDRLNMEKLTDELKKELL